MNLLRPVLRRFSPAGQDVKLSILIFHRVFPSPDPIFPGEPEARWFDRMLRNVGHWFNVLPLDEAVAMLGAGCLPERSMAITFDDGYADNYSVALPILKRHRMSATFFIATSFLDGGRMWNDTVVEAVRQSTSSSLDLTGLGLGSFRIGTNAEKRSAIEVILGKIKYLEPAERLKLTGRIALVAGVKLPDDLMMTTEEVVQMARAGMQIGAHTMSHPILANLGSAEAREEIVGSKVILERELAMRVGLFAYPNGKPDSDYSPKDVEIVRSAGFDAAVTTCAGVAGKDSDRFQLPRFTPWDRSMWRFGARLAQNIVQG